MKISLYYFMFFSCVSLFGQEVFSKYEKYDFDKKGTSYGKLLEIKNTNSLIIKLNEQKFVSFENDGFYTCIIDQYEKLLIEKKKVSSNDSLRISAGLTSIYSINPNILNEVKNGDSEMIINDGVWYEIEFFKENHFLTLKSYSPKEYIQHKYPHYQERALLVNFIDTLYTLFQTHQAEKIKGCNDIYIIYDETISKGIKFNKRKITNEYLFQYTESKGVIFTSNKIDKNNLYLDIESLLLLPNNGKSAFISGTDLHKNGYAFLSSLAKEKRIYIINKKDLKKENILVKRLYLSSF